MSDIHANAHGFKAAIELARRRGFDQLLILGDLLTYGAAPCETLDLAAELIARHGAIMIKGNHDDLYADLAQGRQAYYERLPGWVRESVDWTQDQLDGRDLYGLFPWFEAADSGDILFAHANPFAFGDWRYLNEPADFSAAAAALASQKKRVGVFGHTHRAKLVVAPESGAASIRAPEGGASFAVTPLASGAAALIDAGSVGQPRDRIKKSMMVFLDRRKERLTAEFAAIDYDLSSAVQALEATPLSDAAKEKLFRYLR
jgi:predicted phosphodiesterase